jgi:hypothetical protein
LLSQPRAIPQNYIPAIRSSTGPQDLSKLLVLFA